MDKIVVVVFNTEPESYEGSRILKDLHDQCEITVYGKAVVAKHADGKVTVNEVADEGPLGTLVGMVAGGMAGAIGGGAAVALGATAAALGGPVGIALGATALGAAAGTLSGLTVDLMRSGIDEDFLIDATNRLQPGKFAVIAEIDEEWTTPLDTRMEAAGGTVLRRPVLDVVQDFLDRDSGAIDKEVAELEAEYKQASGEAKAEIQARIDAAKAKRQQLAERTKARVESIQVETEAKIAALKAQAATASAERKQKIEKRAADLMAENKERLAKLDQAHKLEQEAWQLRREALIK